MKHNDIDRVIIGLGLVVIMLLFAFDVRAQDAPFIETWVSAGCVESLSASHYRIHFGYVSNGVETFAVSVDNPNNGTASINTPPIVTTAAGAYDEWYLDAHSLDSPYTFTVTFENSDKRIAVPLNTWDTQWCTEGAYPPEADATPEPDECPAWAVSNATGDMLCLWSLPRVGDWQ